MGTELVKSKKTAMEAMAARLQVSTAQLEKTLKATAFKECRTNEEFIAAVLVANTYGLNPLLNEIYAFPSKKGGITPVVSVDGFIHLMNAQKDHDGCELIENRGEMNASKTDVTSITAKIYTKGKTHPTVVTEYMAECFDGNKGPWQRWPIRMLRHKALIQCARIAYGFSGIYDPDEGDRIASQIAEMPAVEMPQPKNAGEQNGGIQSEPKASTSEAPAPAELSQEEKDEITRQEAEAAQADLNKRKASRKNADRPLI